MQKIKLTPLSWTTQQRTVAHLLSIGWEKNPRNLSPEGKSRLQHSLEKFNLVEIPVLTLAASWTNDQEQMIAGHQRIYVMYQLGRGEELVDVRVPNRPLTEEEFKEYNLRSNTNVGTWDLDLLEQEFADFDLEEIGLDLSGLDFPQNDLSEDEIEEIQEPSGRPSLIKEGDVFEFGNHRLICGDSTDPKVVEKLLEGNTPRLMTTDPPYGVEYDATWRESLGYTEKDQARKAKVDNDDNPDWEGAYRLSQAQIAYVWHASEYSDVVLQGLKNARYNFRQQIIWVKSSAAISRSHYHWQHEPCWYVVKKGMNANWKGDRKQRTVWEMTSPIQPFGRKASDDSEKTVHPTQKPIGLFRKPIINHTSPGEIVYDAFIGSGPALIACEQTGRRCFGIDLNPGWIELSIARWARYCKRINREYEFKHLNGTLTLDQIIENQTHETSSPT